MRDAPPVAAPEAGMRILPSGLGDVKYRPPPAGTATPPVSTRTAMTPARVYGGPSTDKRSPQHSGSTSGPFDA